MKFTNDHLIRLKTAIDHLLKKHPNVVSDYEHGRIQYADKVKCIQTRFCFDLLYASGLKIGDGVGIVGDINGNYNDAHILTALKSVCPKIVKKY